jgi:polyketide biosynthesis enoyl-CoA hydratase PksI
MINSVNLAVDPEHIAIVEMADRQSKNTFSESLIHGLIHTFEKIKADSRIRAVVIHGYDNYFCCGGTKEELLKIYRGELQFDALKFYDLLLQCEVPVISAMQGHAIGGGLVFGSYADLIVMGEECIYTTNFMKYGFTPGMGATCIIPRKFGDILGHEMLFTASNYYGSDLRKRGIPIRVVRKAAVYAEAMALARDLAQKPVIALKELKRSLTHDIKQQVQIAVSRELDMHKVTFAQPEVKTRIEALFGAN